MTEYRLISEPPADADVEAAFEWYENDKGLGWSSSMSFAPPTTASLMARTSTRSYAAASGARFSSVFRMQSTSPSKAMSLSSLQCCMLVAIQQSGSIAEANTPLDPTAGIRSVVGSKDPFTRRGSAAQRSASSVAKIQRFKPLALTTTSD